MSVVQDAAAPAATDPTATALDFRLTVLGSGSSGNCSLISSQDTHLLIDAGFSGKEICARLTARGFDPSHLTAILVTHEHSDHVRSVHTLSRKFGIPIFSTQGTFSVALREKKFSDWYEIVPGRSIQLGTMCVHPISLPHDAVDPVGFRIECDNRVLGHITDFGYASGLVMESLKGCDTLLIEANHDLDMLKEGPYPWSLKQRIAGRLGHLSNASMLDMLPDILHDDVKHLVLAHLSDSNNDRRLLTLQLKRALRRLGLEKIPFTLAEQNEPLRTLDI